MADYDVKITQDSQIKVTDGSKITVKDDSKLGITEVKEIAPIAAHIKEINHIDPIRVEELHLNELKNIEPIRVEKFNITNLPTVNISLRQIPSVDLNVRRLPPVSLGMHQNFQVPSSYLVRARLFGVEFFRVQMNGQTTIIPRERYRREQSRSSNRSFPLTATAGNPAIPSICNEKSSEVCPPAHDHCTSIRKHKKSSKAKWMNGKKYYEPDEHIGDGIGNTNQAQFKNIPTIHSGQPAMNFRISESNIAETFGESSVSSGG